MDSDGQEDDFGFFDEPDTAEIVGRGGRPGRQWPTLSPADGARSGLGGGGWGWPVVPSGLVGVWRLAVFVTVVIASAVALVTGLGGCKGSADNYTRYFDQVGAIAQSSNRAGDQLARDLRSSTLTPSNLARRLQALAAQQQQAYDHAEQIRPPGPLRQIHQELLAALELRALGLATLGQTFATSGSHTHLAASTADALAAQARILTTSDVVWRELYRTPATAELHQRGLARLLVPQSRIITRPGLVAGPSFVRLLQPRNTSATSISGSGVSLKSGDSGPAVTAWQKQLNRWLRTQPAQTLLPVDGTYGTLTTAATKALQQAAGITADGIAGPATRQALAHQLATHKQSSPRG